LLAASARQKVSPEQHARAVAENVRQIYAREAEQAPPLSAGVRRRLRELVDSFDAAAGDTDDGGSAA
jgi:hypothetical protein